MLLPTCIYIIALTKIFSAACRTTLQTPLVYTITHARQLYMFIRMYMVSEILSIQISGYISSEISSSLSLKPIASAAISHRKHPTTTGPQLVTCSNTRMYKIQCFQATWHLHYPEKWPPASKCSSCRIQAFNWETPEAAAAHDSLRNYPEYSGTSATH